MKQGCCAGVFLLGAALFFLWFIGPEGRTIVAICAGLGVGAAIAQLIFVGPPKPDPAIDPIPSAFKPKPMARAPAPAPQQMTKEQLLRRFRRELREGIIDQDEFDALRDIYDF